MSIYCWLLIYQLTTIFLANRQLTTNPISTLCLGQRGQNYTLSSRTSPYRLCKGVSPPPPPGYRATMPVWGDRGRNGKGYWWRGSLVQESASQPILSARYYLSLRGQNPVESNWVATVFRWSWALVIRPQAWETLSGMFLHQQRPFWIQKENSLGTRPGTSLWYDIASCSPQIFPVLLQLHRTFSVLNKGHEWLETKMFDFR